MTQPPMGPRAVARATGVSTDTLRHYERKGLLPRVTRTPAGYRQYTPAIVDRVLLIQRALVVGFSLADLQRVLAIRDRGGAPCHGVRALLDERLKDLDERIQELQALRGELQDLAAAWDGSLKQTRPGERAHLLETLGRSPAIERALEKPGRKSASRGSLRTQRGHGIEVGRAPRRQVTGHE